MEGLGGNTGSEPMVLRTASEIETARKEFKADRYGHNNPTSIKPRLGRITYMAHAKGYVMARRPGAMPFVITEKLWRSFPLWNGLWHGDR